MSRNLFLHVPLNDKILFVQHLSIAIKSGMSLYDGLSMIRKQSRSRSMKKILDTIITDINNGSFLSTSLEKYKGVFGDLFINVVRVGEASGTLTENLAYLSHEMKKTNTLRKKVRGALIYPAIVMTLTLVIATGMVVFVIPKLLTVFSNVEFQLPLATRILIAISNFLRTEWTITLGGVFGFFIGFWFLLKINKVRYYFHYLIIFSPIFGRMVRQMNMSNIARTLSLLLKSGTKIVEAIQITAETTYNLVYKKELQKASELAKTGEYLSKHFATREHLFAPIMTNMIAVGENTGNLTENLSYLSDYYEETVDDFTKNLSTVLEPLLLVVLGIVVGFIALAVILPIYQVTQHVR